MAKLCIYNVIVDEEEKIFLENWDGEQGVCYKDITEFLDGMEEGDENIDIKIHCPGGDCMEGWAIYDALRNSGKKISATIEGECSSMATIILLAAPKERRFAYENASMCIHNPEVCHLDACTMERLTADEIENLKAKLTAQQMALIEEQNKILNLYVERTGSDRETLQKLMDEDKYIGMERARELGFITATLIPNTDSMFNKNKKRMAKEQVKIENRLLKKLLSLAGFAKVEDVKILDQTITAADGTTFTVEREDGDPQVGDRAYPDGSYVLEDGTTIVVAEEVIESITPAEEEEQALEDQPVPPVPLPKRVDDLEQKVAEIEAKVVELEAQLQEQQKTEEEEEILETVAKAGGKKWLDSLKGLSSTYTASNRKFVEHGDSKNVMGETRAQKMLREQRERQEQRRNK